MAKNSLSDDMFMYNVTQGEHVSKSTVKDLKLDKRERDVWLQQSILYGHI